MLHFASLQAETSIREPLILVQFDEDVLDHLWIYGHIGLLRMEEAAFPRTSLEVQTKFRSQHFWNVWSENHLESLTS